MATNVVGVTLKLVKIELAVVMETQRLPIFIFGQVIQDCFNALLCNEN